MLHQDWAVLPVNHSPWAAGYYSPGSHVQTTKCPWQLCLILFQGQSPPVAPWRVRSKGLCTPDTVIWAGAVHAALYSWHRACGIIYITKAPYSGCREQGEESYTGAQMVRTVGVPKAQPHEQQFWWRIHLTLDWRRTNCYHPLFRSCIKNECLSRGHMPCSTGGFWIIRKTNKKRGKGLIEQGHFK